MAPYWFTHGSNICDNRGGGGQYVIWTDINNSICSQGWVSHSHCIMAPGTLHCVSTDSTSEHNLVFRGPQIISPCICLMPEAHSSSLLLHPGVWVKCSVAESGMWLTAEISLGINPCHAQHAKTTRHWNSDILLTLSVILSVSNIASKVQTTFYQNQFKPSGNNSRFSDSD